MSVGVGVVVVMGEVAVAVQMAVQTVRVDHSLIDTSTHHTPKPSYMIGCVLRPSLSTV